MKIIFKLTKTILEFFGVKHRMYIFISVNHKNCIFVGVNHWRCNVFRCKSYASFGVGQLPIKVCGNV